jgi:hypothetical protein
MEIDPWRTRIPRSGFASARSWAELDRGHYSGKRHGCELVRAPYVFGVRSFESAEARFVFSDIDRAEIDSAPEVLREPR